jgi:threonine dehydrogenase-like Zn-dependent dehydrogenase
MVLVRDREPVLGGALMYTRGDYQGAVEQTAAKKVNLKVLQTHHVPFDRRGKGYDLLLHNPANVLKVSVDL